MRSRSALDGSAREGALTIEPFDVVLAAIWRRTPTLPDIERLERRLFAHAADTQEKIVLLTFGGSVLRRDSRSSDRKLSEWLLRLLLEHEAGPAEPILEEKTTEFALLSSPSSRR